jgi:hypothetical protein
MAGFNELNFKCIYCGCDTFKVSGKGNHVQCVFCNEKYVFEDQEWKHEIKEHKTLISKIITKIIPVKEETPGEALKRMGIKKEKKEIALNKKKQIKLHKLKERRKRTQLNWDEEDDYLRTRGFIVYPKNYHKGKLRGKTVARKHLQHLKSIGIKATIHFKDSHSTIRLEK